MWSLIWSYTYLGSKSLLIGEYNKAFLYLFEARPSLPSLVTGIIENIKSDKRQARIKKKFGEMKPKEEIEKPKFMIKVSYLFYWSYR